MNCDAINPWYSGIHKRTALLIAVCAAFCVFAIVWLVCSMEYDAKKKELLAAQQESMDSWVSGTVNAVTLWSDTLREQAQRVSGSELYRLFASELAQMDEQTKTLINEADSGISLPDSASALAEEVPLLRNLLLDFMNYSGLLDARIVGEHGQTLLSSLSRPTPVSPAQQATVEKAIQQGKMAFAPVRSSASGLVVDAADPLNSTMSQGGTESPVGALLVTTPVTGQVAQFLSRDLRQAELKPRLLQTVGNRWEEIRVQSPAPVALNAELTTNLKPDERGSLPFTLRPSLDDTGPVYSLGSRVPGMDWWVVLEMPAAVMDGSLKQQARLIYGIGALVGLGFVLALALLWWVLVGRQQRVIAERFQHLYQLIERQKRLLDSVNESLDVGLFMADVNGLLQVGNPAFAEIVHKDEALLTGCTLAALFDGQAAGRLVDGIRKVAENSETTTFELPLVQPDGDHLYRVTLFPFVDGEDPAAKGAVAILQDITEFRRSSEKRRLQQLHTIDAFVRAIEGVDPYLTGHSQKMAALGALVAERLGLSEADCNTIAQAANLSQVGKLFVPRELLSKTGTLTDEEQGEMARVPEHAYRVLKDIDFELPVPQAVYEMYERVDGTGYPRKLRGDAISVHARVLAVVNSFSAMVSPRPYRAGMTFDEAIKKLRENTGDFDQRVVNLLEEVIRTPDGSAAATAGQQQAG